MSIDKSLKQHYEMQGGVKNYLGKQKMVKAPKKWKSAPGHPKTELAYITKAEKDEDWERAQDWGKIQDLSKKGYGFEEIQDALEKGLLSKTDPQSLKTNLPNLRNWVPKTGLEKSLINSLMPTMTKGGIKDQLGKAAFNLGAKKLGLGSLLSVVNPALFFASFIPGLKGKAPKSAYDLAKNLTANIQTKGLKTQWNEKSDWSKVKPSKDPDERGDGPKTIAEQVTKGAGLEEGQKMLGLDDKQIQQIYQGRNLLNKTIEAGVYQGKRLTADQIKLLQNKQMEFNNLIDAIEKAQAPIPVAYGGRIDKPLTGRSRDI